MSRVLIIGAGGVGRVVTRKCASDTDAFTEICLASRTLAKCARIAAECARPIRTAAVDAFSSRQVADLIRDFRPDLVVNVALPYHDLPIMDACLETGVNYLDTANYEPPDEARFCYRWQWEYHDRYRERGIMALLGCGFDPGVTNIFCAHARKELLDEIETIDILDCNAGEHGHPFATNFNPEINIREVTQPGRYFEEGKWIETRPMEQSVVFDFPEVGPRKAYLLYHEELESLARHFPRVRRLRFWMTFSDAYITHLRVLENVGMTRIDPVEYEGHQIVPLRFLKSLLPDPASLGEGYRGRTSIGCLVEGKKGGKRRRVFIYNVCDHQDAFRDTGAQAVSYTTGVPATVGARLVVEGTWKGQGVFNVEEFDPAPFLELLPAYGLPWHCREWDEALRVEAAG